MNFKAFIFDLDGVICHTDRYHYLAWKKIADKLSIPFCETENDRLRGVSRLDSLDIILEKSNKSFSRQEKLLLAEEKNSLYREMLLKMTPQDLPQGTADILKALRSDGKLLGIGSSSKNTKLILSRLGLSSFFDAVADGTEITHSKPDPEVFLLAADKLHVKPCEAAVVEDAEAGIQAARKGGFCAIGIGSAAACALTDIPIRSLADLLCI